MTTTEPSTTPLIFDHQTEHDDAFSAVILTSLFRNLAGIWTHELRIENATTVDLPTVGHGFCSFIRREATKVKGEDDPAGHVEEMLLHENGEYSIEGSDQAAIHITPINWSRNLVWRMDLRGSKPAAARPQIEKRKESSTERKGSVFSRMTISRSDSLSGGKEGVWQRSSAQSMVAKPVKAPEKASVWRRISASATRRKSSVPVFETSTLLQKADNKDERDEVQEGQPPLAAQKVAVPPQIDIYATKSETGKISFHLHTLKFDLRANVWRQSLYDLEDITIKAHGEHFTGEERYGINYEFLLRWEPPRGNDCAGGRYYVLQWNTVDVVRGPAGKDKTTITHYGRSRRQHLAATPQRTRLDRETPLFVPL